MSYLAKVRQLASKSKRLAPSRKPPLALLPLLRNYSGLERALFGLGALSFISIVVILFLPISKGPPVIQPTAIVAPAGSRDFTTYVSQLMAIPVDSGPPIELLENGDASISSILKDIDAAGQSINIMAYIWKDGTLSDRVLSHLITKQRAGIQVRILLDAYGGMKAPAHRLDELKKAGGRVATFHSLLPLPWTVMRSTKRNHRRAFVVDGKIAYTGGLGVDDVWLGNARGPSEWHDLMFRVQGSMAARLQGSFAEVWAAETGEILAGEQFFPKAQSGGSIPYVALSSSPSPDLYEAETFVLLALSAARREIRIETPYFLPDASVRKVLIDKAKAGVKVTILVPNEHSDEKSVRWASQRIYQELLEAGIKIYEYQPTFTHTKLLVEDGIFTVIGSANMDIRSRRLNDEVMLGVSDAKFAVALEKTFDSDLKRSKKIDLLEWRRRGILQRLLEIVSQAFVQQY
jgi:cardiolipin synthase